MHRRVVITVAALALVALALPAFGQDAAKKFVGANQCKMCHNKAAEGQQWNQWHGTRHAKALETLKGDEAKAVATKVGLTTPPAESAECLKCHVTGYDEAAKKAPAGIKMEEGVGCEVCHGPGGDHTAAAKKAMTQKDQPWDASATIVGKPEEATCTKCHNPESPTWDPERYTTADGKKVGFDFEQAHKKIAHVNPKKAGETAVGGDKQ